MLSRSLSLIDTQYFVDTEDKWYRQHLKLAENSDQEKYKMIDGILYHKVPAPISDREWKLCVPMEYRKHTFHDAHPGFFKTLRRIQSKYYWPSLMNDVSEWVRQCETCRECKASNENTVPKMITNRYAEFPGQILAMDYIGPYPR